MFSHEVLPFAGCFTSDSKKQDESRLAFVGLPDDSQSTYRRGCSKAPDRIRMAYDGHCYNATTESGVDLAERVTDFGNLPSLDLWATTAENYSKFARSLFAAVKIPFFAGGDHAVTVPVVEALGVLENSVHIVQIDAHPDLYQEYDASRTSHACTAARLLEMDHVQTLTQIGVRTLNATQLQVAERYPTRLRIVSAREYTAKGTDLSHISESSLVYVTLDLDALDPAYAPGVSHPVPGGLTSREVLDLIQALPGRLVGMDAVEVNPNTDLNDRTAILAAKCLHEAMGIALRQSWASRPKPFR